MEMSRLRMRSQTNMERLQAAFVVRSIIENTVVITAAAFLAFVLTVD